MVNVIDFELNYQIFTGMIDKPVAVYITLKNGKTLKFLQTPSKN